MHAAAHIEGGFLCTGSEWQPQTATPMLNRLNAQMQTANFTGISFFIKALSIQQVILCMLFGIWVATKHQTKGKPQELLSVHWSTARPDVATSQFVYSVIQEAAPQDMAQSCSQLSDTHDQQWCVMSKMPVSYTHPNRAESLWPGESCNEPFLLLVLVMLHAQFALLYTWVSPASKMLYNLRMFLIVGVQSTLVALTVVSLWGWNVGFSSAFLCTAAIVLSFALVWDILYQVRMMPRLQPHPQSVVPFPPESVLVAKIMCASVRQEN